MLWLCLMRHCRGDKRITKLPRSRITSGSWWRTGWKWSLLPTSLSTSWCEQPLGPHYAHSVPGFLRKQSSIQRLLYNKWYWNIDKNKKKATVVIECVHRCPIVYAPNCNNDYKFNICNSVSTTISSSQNIVDLLSLVPFFAQISMSQNLVVRCGKILRIFRIFRVIKLFKYVE